MGEYRFLNPHQPPTLVNATILGYIEAFFGLINSGGTLLFLAIAVGLGAGAFGIANEKQWGYNVALGAAVLNALIYVIFLRADVFTFPTIISFAIAVVLVVLIAHPMSREYQKIWFR